MCDLVHQQQGFQYIFAISLAYVSVQDHFVEDKVRFLQVEHDVEFAHTLKVLRGRVPQGRCKFEKKEGHEEREAEARSPLVVFCANVLLAEEIRYAGLLPF